MNEVMDEIAARDRKEREQRAIYDSPELQRAYDIHGQHYNGQSVGAEDQAFYDKYVTELAAMDEQPFGIALWLLYALKYVTS